VPERCGLRVDNETFDQREGEIIAFDDSFDHEAWNNSQQPRLVLIFEVWHPDLTKDEQDAISATFDARVKWLAQRTIT
jgi:aspartyl/asparaginyl beta-hydroxylase (cupin superfamily)